MELAEKKGIFDTICPKLIEDAVEILDALLNEK
jgi:hypothetical protein